MLTLFNRKNKNLENYKNFDEQVGASSPWIFEDKYAKRIFNFISDQFRERPELYHRLSRKRIVFIPSEGKYASVLYEEKMAHTIILFQEFYQFARSGSPLRAAAILAHEMGHIYHRHHERKLSTLEKQIEADHFAYLLGLGRELQDILIDEEFEKGFSLDTKVRISRLTTYLL